MNKNAEARRNMLDCQLATNGVTTPEVLEVFGKTPRERFLPENLRDTAYLDEDIDLGGGAFFMEPMVHARMIQTADPRKQDAVLNIGDMTGYSSAILSDLVSTVVALESKTGTLDKARGIWDELNFCNIAVVQGKETEGSPEHAPFGLIVINGAVPAVPEKLLGQLAPGGRLVTVVKKPGYTVGCITAIEKIEGTGSSTRRFFDAATPYAPGFEPVSTFKF